MIPKSVKFLALAAFAGGLLCTAIFAQQAQVSAGFRPAEQEVLQKLQATAGHGRTGLRTVASGTVQASNARATAGWLAELRRQKNGRSQINLPMPGVQGSPMQSQGSARAFNCGTAGIHQVDGLAGGAIFTASTEFQSYVKGYSSNVDLIQGCGFGRNPGTVFLDPPYDPAPGIAVPISRARQTNGMQRRLQLKIPDGKWTDTSILVQVDPQTAGFLSSENVTLHVFTADGHEYQASGFKFYPVFEKQHLSHLPASPTLYAAQPPSDGQNFTSLQENKDSNGNLVGPHYFSSAQGSVVFDASHTLAVVRVAQASFSKGTDWFDVSGPLRTDFTISDYQLSTINLGAEMCKRPMIYATDGAWNAMLIAGELQVRWKEEGCSNPPRVLGPVHPGSATSPYGPSGGSFYAVDITVYGPRGANPLR